MISGYNFRRPVDWHRHLRTNIYNPDGSLKFDMLSVYINELILGGFCGARLMLNLGSPVMRMLGKSTKACTVLPDYKAACEDAGIGQLGYVDYCLYLGSETTRQDIDAFKKAGGRSVKKYPYTPPKVTSATTNSEASVPIDFLIANGVMDAIVANGLVFCEHGEVTDLPPYLYANGSMNVEAYHYLERAPRLIEKYPGLRYSAEHLTTPEGIAFVRALGGQAFGTFCFQHMLYLVSHLVRDMNVFLACMPRVKELLALLSVWEAAFGFDNQLFGLGSDDAPHTRSAKHKECGCASGCCAGRHVLAEYASAFEMTSPTWRSIIATLDKYADRLPREYELFWRLPRRSFDNPDDRQVWEDFTCNNGNRWNGVPASQKEYLIERKPAQVEPLITPDGPVIPLSLGMNWMSENNAKLAPEDRTATVPYTVTLVD